MELDLPKTVAIVAVVIAVGVGGLIGADVMPTDVVLMMVLPSMVVFALAMVLVGVKHGEYRATN